MKLHEIYSGIQNNSLLNKNDLLQIDQSFIENIKDSVSDNNLLLRYDDFSKKLWPTNDNVLLVHYGFGHHTFKLNDSSNVNILVNNNNFECNRCRIQFDKPDINDTSLIKTGDNTSGKNSIGYPIYIKTNSNSTVYVRIDNGLSSYSLGSTMEWEYKESNFMGWSYDVNNNYPTSIGTYYNTGGLSYKVTALGNKWYQIDMSLLGINKILMQLTFPEENSYSTVGHIYICFHKDTSGSSSESSPRYSSELAQYAYVIDGLTNVTSVNTIYIMFNNDTVGKIGGTVTDHMVNITWQSNAYKYVGKVGLISSNYSSYPGATNKIFGYSEEYTGTLSQIGIWMY